MHNLIAAADWAHARPYGDAAGLAVTAVLETLTGPPRVAVCTLDAPVAAEVPGAVMVQATWPVLGTGVDVVVLVHTGALPAQARSRMVAGPQDFIIVASIGEAETVTVSPNRLGRIRARLLSGELAALAARWPDVGELVAVARPRPHSVTRNVAVIGPDAAAVARVRTGLADHLTVVDTHHPSIDVVVAVAGSQGWMRDDVRVVEDARHRIGRVVVTAPLPGAQRPGIVAADDSPAAILAAVERLCAEPVPVHAPEIRDAQWHMVVDKLERRCREAMRNRIEAAYRSGDSSVLRELAAERGRELGPLFRPSLVQIAVVVVGIVATGVIRVELLPIAVAVGGARIAQMRALAHRRWWAEARAQLEVGSTSDSAPVSWVRRRWVQNEREAGE